MKKLTIEDKLAKTSFKVNEESHIKVSREWFDWQDAEMLCRACPAGLYRIEPDGKLHFSHLGCLECGTCRVLGIDREVEDWDYPIGGYGVTFRKS